jgi:magnesium chelatase family protein
VSVPPPIDMSDIRGQNAAIESLVMALSRPSTRGVVLVGPPGAGTTLIARRIPTILPELTEHQRTWVAAENEGAGFEAPARRSLPEQPFRAPHHTISTTALNGQTLVRGYKAPVCQDNPGLRTWCYCKRSVPAHPHHVLPREVVPRAGELRLARFGVLMLDEIAEFSQSAIEVLAHGLERMAGRPLVVATARPCPCGWRGSDSPRLCTCPESSVLRHKERVAKALVKLGINPESDSIRVPFVRLDDLRRLPPGPTSESLRRRIELARKGGA